MIGMVQLVAGFATIVSLIFYFHRIKCGTYPLLGMLPRALKNLGHINDYASKVLQRRGGTYNFVGPWFTGMNYLVTCDPMNLHHMLSKNFSNYVKGQQFRDIFDVFGDGIFAADNDAWKYHRTLLRAMIKTKSFEKLLEKIVRKKIKNDLFLVLDHVERKGIEVDLQQVFNSFNFDITCSTILGSDPECLSVDFQEAACNVVKVGPEGEPEKVPDHGYSTRSNCSNRWLDQITSNPKCETVNGLTGSTVRSGPILTTQVACERAFNEVGECIFYRHTVPKIIWKLQRWLGIGPEKKMAKACEVFNKFLNENIASKREDLNKAKEKERENNDLLTYLMREEEGKERVDDKFLRDTAFNLFLAGRDGITSALTWFFWLVAKHPLVEANILREIKQVKEGSEKDQVYLHAALCESMRLYPPIPFERKQAIKQDMFPSGHEVDAGTMIIISLYATGRYEEAWGKDCLEFKPERWISERGNIVHIPSYKFICFNAGPRTCLGKDMSFIQMKIVASSILRNYHVHLVEHHPVAPSFSIALLMRYGLKVRITKRGMEE